MFRVVSLSMVVLISGSVFAELQNVEVGGEIRVRFRGDLDYLNDTGSVARVPLNWVPGRAIGAAGLQSRYHFDDRGNDRHFAEMRTRLHVKADFTEEVSAYVELDSTDMWGEDFRSNYVTGTDGRGVTSNDVEVFQSYVEVNEIFGYPVCMRVGRQTLKMGKGWLVGDRPSAVTGLSFDAIRVTYACEDLSVDAWWSKLNENSPAEQDGDVDFYGVYGTYTGIEALSLSAYWMFVRDARSVSDTDLDGLHEWTEELLGLDDYPVTALHTAGIRAWGACGAWDYDAECAYQFGDAGQQGAWFVPVGGTYGDDGAEFGAWAADFEAGYRFDVPWKPRLYAGCGYYQGEDNRQLSFWEWLLPTPYGRSETSICFNRLFPNTSAKYSWILDGGQVLSNFLAVRLGLTFAPFEKVNAAVEVEKFWVDEPFDLPVMLELGRRRIAVAPAFSFWTQKADDDLGTQVKIWGTYNYSDDLSFKLSWEHLFAGQGVRDGSFVDRYGLNFLAGSDQDDADRIECVATLKF